ncbi:hypothetical protein [Shewanella sp.]|uniref:hypothetical protein n=1 Tax=Shewanella sp. TaxID=50422 RepID=UPI003564FBDB
MSKGSSTKLLSLMGKGKKAEVITIAIAVVIIAITCFMLELPIITFFGALAFLAFVYIMVMMYLIFFAVAENIIR